MWILALLASAALAAPVTPAPVTPTLSTPRVDPGLEPSGVEDLYRAWALGERRAPPRRELVCRPFAERVTLCFSRIEAAGRVYFTRADARDVASLESASLAGKGTESAPLANLQPVSVEGASRSYWVSAQGDGRDHVGLLFPDLLAARVAGPAPRYDALRPPREAPGRVVVAAPARGVLVAWVSGDSVFDTLVAVGIRRMYDTLPDPVSTLIYHWDGTAWLTWGEARDVATDPTDPSALPSPGSRLGAPMPGER